MRKRLKGPTSALPNDVTYWTSHLKSAENVKTHLEHQGGVDERVLELVWQRCEGSLDKRRLGTTDGEEPLD